LVRVAGSVAGVKEVDGRGRGGWQYFAAVNRGRACPEKLKLGLSQPLFEEKKH